ncbi:hypothetical protein LIER_30572 [Lithospermum erythrorhizon]|uniref:Uncharacterized protein n=1 Tax=Lithospermum erythrorhizon TaxID=34254 RepID=A0AAV3RNN3_LITER
MRLHVCQSQLLIQKTTTHEATRPWTNRTLNGGQRKNRLARTNTGSPITGNLLALKPRESQHGEVEGGGRVSPSKSVARKSLESVRASGRPQHGPQE